MFRSTSNFEKLLDKATSNLRLEPDWPTILQLCDLIRQGDIQPRQALGHIRKKILNENPHIAYFGLLVLESCVKNCGSLIHEEIGTTTYMNQLRELLKTTTQEKLKNKILELIQAWAFAFRNSPKYRAVQDTMNILKAEDYKFPALKESDAMFSADTAPEWLDGDCCHRCRVQFTITQRKHHCRACGQVFCKQCSSKSCTLPKFGIEKEVRVCDTCLATNTSKSSKPSSSPSSKSEDLPTEYLNSSLAKQNQAPPPRKSDEELQEEEELQLAIALSQSEAEQKTSQKFSSTRAKNYAFQNKTRTSSPPVEEVDPELAHYLNRSYWENRPQPEEQQQQPQQQQQQPHSSPSAPANFAHLMTSTKMANSTASVEQNGVGAGVESDAQLDEFVLALQDQVDVFVNRMQSNYSRGRSITNDSTVQSSFMSITDARSKLLRYIQQQDDRRVYYEGLQDKLAQVKDARAALNALREEHREKLRRDAEKAEQLRQLQMAQKLEIMRKKKQEYLQYQRQVALQRIQEQEREMQMRQEQQKQQYMMGPYNPISYIPPGGYEAQGGIPSGANMVNPHANPGFPAPVPTGYQFPMNEWRPNYMGPNQAYAVQQGRMVPMVTPHGQMVRGPPGMGPPPSQPQLMSQVPPQPQGLPPQSAMGPHVPHVLMSPKAGAQGSAPFTSSQSAPQMVPGSNPQIMTAPQMMMPMHGMPMPVYQPQMGQPQPHLSQPQMQTPNPPPHPHQPQHAQPQMQAPQNPPLQSQPQPPQDPRQNGNVEPPQTAELISFD